MLRWNSTHRCCTTALQTRSNAVAVVFTIVSVGGDNWINKGLPERLEFG